jgi:hypothetical protein
MVEEHGIRAGYDREALAEYFTANWYRLFGALRKSKALEVPSDALRKSIMIHWLLDLIEMRRDEDAAARAARSLNLVAGGCTPRLGKSESVSSGWKESGNAGCFFSQTLRWTRKIHRLVGQGRYVISKLRMQTCRDCRYRPAVSVVGGIGDELIIEGQLPGVDGQGVVGFQDFFRTGMGKLPVSDDSG